MIKFIIIIVLVFVVIGLFTPEVFSIITKYKFKRPSYYNYISHNRYNHPGYFRNYRYPVRYDYYDDLYYPYRWWPFSWFYAPSSYPTPFYYYPYY
jgi:hypothetical protein